MRQVLPEAIWRLSRPPHRWSIRLSKYAAGQRSSVCCGSLQERVSAAPGSIPDHEAGHMGENVSRELRRLMRSLFKDGQGLAQRSDPSQRHSPGNAAAKDRLFAKTKIDAGRGSHRAEGHRPR